jgi:DNA-binding NarL/FixJ family response regulator
MRRTSVVIADRHPVVLLGLMKVLETQPDFTVVACCSDGMSCIEAMRNLMPDIAILEISIPELSGLEILDIANSENLATRLVFFTASVDGDELAMAAVDGGYSVILKDATPEILVQTLRQVASGRRLLPQLASCHAPAANENRFQQKRTGGADGARATDHASGLRRAIEQGNWAPAEYCGRYHQAAPASHLSEA